MTILALFEVFFCSPLGIAAVAICWPLGIALCKYADSKALLCFDIMCICFALISTLIILMGAGSYELLYIILFFYPASIVLTIIYVRQVRKNRKK